MNRIAVVLQISPKVSTKLVRAYFTEIKRPALSKSALFLKKTFSWFETKVSKTTSSWGIRLPTALLDNPIQEHFCQTKVPFCWSEGPFFKNNLIPFFVLHKQFLKFSYFSFEIFLSHISHIMSYMLYKVWKLIMKTKT